MTDYTVQAALAADLPLRRRVAACVAGLQLKLEGDPLGWAYEHAWAVATQPGWCCAVHDGDGTSAMITDQMILAAVEAIYVPPPDHRESDPTESPA